VVSGSFNDQKYIDQWKKSGQFPTIHDQVAYLVKNFASEREPAIDIGACIGILAVRNVEEGGRSFCVGIEGNEFDYSRAIRHANVAYHKFYISTSTLDHFEKVLAKYKPSLLTARRVISELDAFDPKVMDVFPQVCRKYGIKKIVLQGRVKVKNPKVRLYCTEKEIEPFLGQYAVTQTYKSAALLEAL
jgi:hypothetical protein